MRKNKDLIWMGFVLVLLSCLHLNRVSIVDAREVVIPPPPTVVLLYPEFLKNGSSFILRDFLYYTATGDLSQLKDIPISPDAAYAAPYHIRYHWDGENWNEGMYEGQIWNAPQCPRMAQFVL